MKRNDNTKILRPRRKCEYTVFAHYKDLLGQIVYKFLGEFYSSLEETDDYQFVFIRKKTKIYFKEFKSK